MGTSCRKPSVDKQLYHHGKECSSSMALVVPVVPVVVPVATLFPTELGQPMSSDGRYRFKWTCVQAHQSDRIDTMWQDPAANLFFPAGAEDALINQRFYYWKVVEC